ncbi:hypothetical protein D3C72_2326320 [compost metagenome]
MVNRPKRTPKRASNWSVMRTAPLSSAPAIVTVLKMEPGSKMPEVMRLKLSLTSAVAGSFGLKSGIEASAMISPV